VEYNCALIKVDWLAACIALRVIGAVFFIFLRRWRTIAQPSSQWQAKPIPEKMSQTLLINKKQGNLD
jgi:hypothetical protein